MFLLRTHPANEPFIDFVEHFYNKGGLMVDMGCGDKKCHSSFLGIDPYSEHEDVNVKAFMWETPLDDDSVDLLVCFSALEHVSKFQVVPSLKEFERILKPGGALAIIVPNLMSAVSEWAMNPNNGWEMDLIFGSQEHEGEFHKTGFTVDIIKGYFTNVPKLQIVNIWDINGYSQWNYGIAAIKSRG